MRQSPNALALVAVSTREAASPGDNRVGMGIGRSTDGFGKNMDNGRTDRYRELRHIAAVIPGQRSADRRARHIFIGGPENPRVRGYRACQSGCASKNTR